MTDHVTDHVTDQLSKHDRDDEDFAWVRQAYVKTPAPAEAAVEAAKRAVEGMVSLNDDSRVSSGAPSVWRRWRPAAGVVAVAGVVCAVWIGNYSSPGEKTGASSPSAKSSITDSAALDKPRGLAPSSPILSPTPTAGTSSTLEAPRVASAMVPHPHAVVNPAPAMDSVSRRSVVTPSLASAQPAHPDANMDPSSIARAVDGLDAESAVLVQRILDSAKGRGLPVAVLVSRVQEGVHRGVPGPRIVVVARNLVAALNDASTTLGPSASSVEIQAGAQALVAGAPVVALQQLRSARPQGAITEPILALTDLTTHGVAPLQASAALATLVSHNGSDGAVQALRARVVGDILRGRSPNAALADWVRQGGPSNLSDPQRPSALGGAPDSLTRQPHTP